jgi:histidinol-phosphate aminotransferase
MSSAPNVAAMHKAQSPYSVNAVAAAAAVAAVAERAYIENYAREALAAREMIYRGLDKLGIAYWKSEANFVLFQAGERAIAIRDALRDRGVLVRDRSYEIAGTVRVTCGTCAQAERFLAELERLW